MRIPSLIFILWWFKATICLADHIQRELNYWAQKDVVISILTPGSSHVTWVLEIGQELASKGHNVTFLARDDNLRYAKDYPGVNVQSISEPIFTMNDESWADVLKKEDSRIESMKLLLNMVNRNFVQDYQKHVEYIQKYKPDLFICDHLTDSCIRAAEMYNMPFILTSTVLTASGE
jgi:UDP:flavonoid glycosyltransferase YjiC (YdhE family)